jgi:Glycosyltransferase
VPRKGFDVLLKALPSVIKEIPDLHLTIIGNGEYYDELVRLSHELRVETFVDILTDVEDKTEYWRKASLFVLAAREDGPNIEGFGIVTLEAASFGLPVVVCRSGGAPEAVLDNVTGLIVPPNDPTALSAAIVSILNNPDRTKKMGEAGRKYVAEEYSIPIIAKRFWSIVK